MDDLIDSTALNKLRWRCRRGLLENDLFIERFFMRHAAELTVKQAKALSDLMQLDDRDLLDLHMRRKPLAAVEPALDRPDVQEVLDMLQSK